ncbi:flavodoxin [Actinotalea ferrariae CF5-4]|uniref:Flavodoxin n=1 Tax=Actinotalea ferrariae CF5-4 TaxID=948458 RepID=A0A021VT61_9CELL|nr:flavodoxin family protein [Actinotalea ferrariae]EYR64341.1 flavodoxin [Actinotalea ferrariae CF5-4]
MTALVVYESMFGSTRAIAEAVGAGLAEVDVPARVVEVGELDAERADHGLPEDVTLLVVGGPTHAFSMSRDTTRADAAKEVPGGHVISERTGVREWIDRLRLPGRMPVATFDTKVAKPALPGSAARAAAKRLRAIGAREVLPPHSFKVHGKADGLVDGELDAARAWGRELGARSR